MQWPLLWTASCLSLLLNGSKPQSVSGHAMISVSLLSYQPLRAEISTHTHPYHTNLWGGGMGGEGGWRESKIKSRIQAPASREGQCSSHKVCSFVNGTVGRMAGSCGLAGEFYARNTRHIRRGTVEPALHVFHFFMMKKSNGTPSPIIRYHFETDKHTPLLFHRNKRME